MYRTNTRRSSGFTLIEITIALVLLVVVVGNVYWLLQKTTTAISSQNTAYDIDTHARRAMDKIIMALVGARANDVMIPTGSPNYTSLLNYRESMGLDANGADIPSDPQRIERTNVDGGEVTWFKNPDTSNEKRVIFTRNVPQFLKDELGNGVDDNANGIIDETGLAFEMNDRNSITVYLTLTRTMPDGTVVSRELHETVTCRN
ncbi:MAG: prepilin-type N-terminal cleavage/methylation domain-containing protein [Planctomycetes bacterium]|nr:prepilin-type N-terminal cleavage/methylation domain-containing protein [Planctomycetota bacterium]